MDFSSGIHFFFAQLQHLLFSLGSHFSASSLAVALAVATLFFAWQRIRRGRRLRWHTIWRALFPRRLMRHPSNQIDIFYLFLNVFSAGIMFGWAVLAYQFLTNSIIAGLVILFGPLTPSTLPVIALPSALFGNQHVDFNQWAWFFTVLRTLVIAIASFAAYRIIFVGGQTT